MRLSHKLFLGSALALLATGALAKRDKLEELPPAPVVEAPQPFQPAMPQDKVNYDEVGYAGSLDADGVAIAHPSLPIGSFAEVTSLSSGRTILTMVASAGPLAKGQIAALTPAAVAQLGLADGSAGVRVRRTNPPEHERAALRNGGQAAERLETPPALLNALRKKLGAPPVGVLAKPVPAKPMAAPKPVMAKRPPPPPAPLPAPIPAPPERAGADFDTPEGAAAVAVADAEAAAPMPPRQDGRFIEEEYRPHWKVGRTPEAGTLPPVAKPRPPVTRPIVKPAPRPVAQPSGSWYVQVAAFSSAANARATASRVGGGIVQAGSIYRVRTGPYASEAAARAALGPLAAKGYRGARITR